MFLGLLDRPKNKIRASATLPVLAIEIVLDTNWCIALSEKQRLGHDHGPSNIHLDIWIWSLFDQNNSFLLTMNRLTFWKRPSRQEKWSMLPTNQQFHRWFSGANQSGRFQILLINERKSNPNEIKILFYLFIWGSPFSISPLASFGLPRHESVNSWIIIFFYLLYHLWQINILKYWKS